MSHPPSGRPLCRQRTRWWQALVLVIGNNAVVALICPRPVNACSCRA